MSTRRTGITRFLDEVIDSTKDLSDGVIDRMSDAEHDIRRGLTRIFENRDGKEDGGKRNNRRRGRSSAQTRRADRPRR